MTPRRWSGLPGAVASACMVALVAFWTWWSVNEMYHEGWWGAWWNPLAYLTPVAVTLIPTLLAFRWPLAGGLVIVMVGTFAFFFFGSDVAVIGLTIALLGLAFIADGVALRRKAIGAASDRQWRTRWRYIVALGAPLVILLGVSAYRLPVVLTRVDDGNRSARRIEGNGVALTWAPAGPGWNWKQPWGGYPSWQSIALYGVRPIGLQDKPGFTPHRAAGGAFATEEHMRTSSLCIFLSEDGTRLEAEPQHVWRMPTTDEVVRSLGRDGRNARCTWSGKSGFAACDVHPDKESPLWATDVPVIYYWTAESRSDRSGYFVSYNGAVNSAYKPGGNPRHGYRCVRG